MTPDDMKAKGEAVVKAWLMRPALAEPGTILDTLADAIAAALAEAYAAGLEMAAKAAEQATLPEGYQWGREAMDSFNLGKERAAAAIRALAGRAGE